MTLARTALPRPAPARVLACGAFLKNRACLLEGDAAWWSELHGDLGEAGACAALEQSVAALRAAATGPIAAVAHDLHPDFHSTRIALELADALGVPAIGVQHHHAHIAVVQAEQGLDGPVIGLALDGIGLGTDGSAWGGEVLQVGAAAQAQRWQRRAHLPTLRLPGGDVAAREPWRMAAALLQASGQADRIVPWLAPQVGERPAALIAQMLARGLNCPPTSSAGRWFDAVAGLLRLSHVQREEAEAAIALERCATDWLETHAVPRQDTPSLDLLARVPTWLAWCPPHAEGAALAEAQGRVAAHFHLALAQGLAATAEAAAREAGAATVVLGGGCFFNRLLTRGVRQALAPTGLAVTAPQALSCGDAGLALGQAWIAACTVADPEFLSSKD